MKKTLYEIQSEYRSKHEREQIRYAGRILKLQKKTIWRDLGIMLLVLATIYFVYLVFPSAVDVV